MTIHTSLCMAWAAPSSRSSGVGRGLMGRPDHMSLHLDALGRTRRRGPGNDSGRAAQAGPQLVPQLPGVPLSPLLKRWEPRDSQGPLGLLVLALRLRLDGLVILLGQATLGLLDLLVQLLAQLLAQLLVGEPPLPSASSPSSSPQAPPRPLCLAQQ